MPKTPIEAFENLKMEIFRSLKIPECVEWLSKRLNKYDKKIRNN